MKKWDCWQGAESRIKAIERKNPLLSFQLCSLEDSEVLDLEKKDYELDPDCDVVYIDGVCQIDVDEFLSQGKEIVFIENDLNKVRSFLVHSNLIEHERVDLVSGNQEELKRVAWKFLYAKPQYIGTLLELEKYVDGVHLSASDVHQSKLVAKNIQSNILRSHEFINGQSLENFYSGCTAIICGSGPSLNEEAIAQIRELEGYAVVIGTGSAMPKLERFGIRLDFGVYIDPAPPLDEYEKMTTFDFPLFYQNRMCEKLFSLHKGEKIWMGTSGGWKLDEKLMQDANVSTWELDSGWNAGTFGVQIASFLGCKKIIMVGLDNGMKKDRELRKGEVVVENMITRRDLVRARDWLSEFVLKHSDHTFIMPDSGLRVDGVTYLNQWAEGVKRKPNISKPHEKQELNFPAVAQTIGDLNSGALLESLEEFLHTLSEGVEHEDFIREKILLEVELDESILIKYVLKDLWDVSKHIYEREGREISNKVAEKEDRDLILKAIFFRNSVKEVVCENTSLLEGLSQGILFRGMLEGEVRRSYPSGAVCSIEYYRTGKRHGKWLRMYESGDLMSEVGYLNGKLHGDFILWGERGKKREGSYWYGRKDGRHKVYHSSGNVLFDGMYDKGEPTLQHDTYNQAGKLIEKVIYHTPKKFDRYCYNGLGDIVYRGVFKGDAFEEVHLDGEDQMVAKRKGKWVEEALVWD